MRGASSTSKPQAFNASSSDLARAEFERVRSVLRDEAVPLKQLRRVGRRVGVATSISDSVESLSYQSLPFDLWLT